MKPIIDLIVPSDLEERKKRYHTTNILTAIIPSIWIGLHTIFFIANDIPILSELGIVVSVLMLSALYWASQRKYQLASSMTAFVHVIFIGAAMVILGWKSGMQFHFIPMGLNAQVNVKGSIKYKFVVGFLMFLLFLGATIYTSYYPPTFQLSVNLLNLMLFFNVALSLSSIPALNANVKTYEETEEKLLMSNALNEQLLYNILPEEVARELRETGRVEPARFEEVTIIFSDFKGFTNIVASIPTKKLIAELNEIFSQFDDIMESEGVEKIQTVGDAYLAACGLPTALEDHALRCVRAGKKMIDFLNERNKISAIKWTARIGIHSGPISAGVIGKKKFAYDIFGDTINTASRIESNGEAGRINISAYTYDLIKEEFSTEYRGKIHAKGKGELDMYFVK